MPGTDKPEDLPPREPRQNVLLGAQISGFGGGARTHHRIRDLTAQGARVDQAGGLRVGATVLVSVGVLEEVGATVVWMKDGVAGLRFAHAIDPEAARSKTILSPNIDPAKAANEANAQTPGTRSLGAGWLPDLHNPYRK